MSHRFPDDLTVIDGAFVEVELGRDTLVPAQERNPGRERPWLTTPGEGRARAEVAPADIGPAGVETLRAAGYEVIGELGRGGMGVVYLARKVALNRPCALKMILAGAHGGKSATARFRVEAEAVARLRHPGIVQIYHVGEADGLPFLELEYLPGGSLEKAMDGTPRPAVEAARLVESLSLAIAEAHRRGIVHRDLKPANILIDGVGQPKVADFGLAKILDSTDGLTKTNLVIGSPSYMAPEQAEGNARSADMTVDVHAMGAILYELLTGRPPFRACDGLGDPRAGQVHRARTFVAAPARPASRPRDDLHEVPGEIPIAAIRHFRGTSRRPSKVPGQRADPGTTCTVLGVGMEAGSASACRGGGPRDRRRGGRLPDRRGGLL